ncbi:hypothetical protein [Mucilaginibacter limnophilus]|uniref:hypothetical protein n=1 Tax=Mucilaginibacter limnophilus TaxID=1932778 RepID=UPI001F0C940D|nr:hypothetical protein [Mucilaginibacter limnophilus]
MKINFKQPRYILPLILLPFLYLFFYVYKSSAKRPVMEDQPPGIQTSVGDVSPDIRDKRLSDKLDAYRNTYKEADGSTAVNPIVEEKTLDSIDQAIKQRFQAGAAVESPLAPLYQPPAAVSVPADHGVKEREPPDPMTLFKAQMAYMDSLSKAADPEYQVAKQREKSLADRTEAQLKNPPLPVAKAISSSPGFNTVIAARKEQQFITAIID